MGGGPDKEHLLVIHYEPKPDTILKDIKQQFPYIDITYLQTHDGKVSSDTDLKAAYRSATILATLGNLPEKPEDVPK